MTALEKSILATLVYADVFERPLTAWEIFRYAIAVNKKEIYFHQVLEALDKSQFLSKRIEQKNGLYFLNHRQPIIEQRMARQKIADQKWKKVKRVIKFLQVVPYIRLVAVSGSLALNNPKPESDIDLLIVTKASRIWTCRALATLFFQLIGQRRHDQLTKDRFCLNHYITDQSLALPAKSLYNAQTYAHLVPVLDTDNLIRQFQQTNQWVKDYLSFYPSTWQGYLKKIKASSWLVSIGRLREAILNNFFGDWLESFLKAIQINRIQKDPLTYKAGGRVVFNDQQLEFHPDSPEKDILEKYNKQMKKLGLPGLAHQSDSGLLTN